MKEKSLIILLLMKLFLKETNIVLTGGETPPTKVFLVLYRNGITRAVFISSIPSCQQSVSAKTLGHRNTINFFLVSKTEFLFDFNSK